MSETKSTFQLTPGAAAPDFSLPDPSGKSHALTDLKGEKGTLVIFACNHCPYVIHLAEAISHLAADLKQQGINTIAISSNDVENYPADSPDKMTTFASESGWDFPYLYDESQEVAQAYAAACTPDFYLFDDELKLFYAGQFDSSRPKNEKPVTGADLRAATEALLQKQNPPSPTIPSSGCNIKWKPGNEPSYFG